MAVGKHKEDNVGCDERFVLTGNGSKILGNWGDYEVTAGWKWSVKAGKSTLLSILLAILFLGLLVTAFVAFSVQYRIIQKLQCEVESLKQDVTLHNDSVMKKLILLQKQGLDSLESERFKRGVGSKGNKSRGGGSSGLKRKKGKSRRVNTTSDANCNKVTAVHFEGSFGFYTSPPSGEIRHWAPSKWSEQFLLAGFRLEDERSKVVVENGGLYLIYAQMHYSTNNTACSFEICVKGEEIPEKFSQVVAECSVGQVVNKMDISCFTAVAHVLRPGDSVFVRQKQKYVNYSMGFGRSFLGLVSLSG